MSNFNTQQLILTDEVQISAATSSKGRGGSIAVTAPKFVSFGGNSQLSIEASNVEKAVNVTINTDSLTIDKQASVSATSTTITTFGLASRQIVLSRECSGLCLVSVIKVGL